MTEKEQKVEAREMADELVAKAVKTLQTGIRIKKYKIEEERNILCEIVDELIFEKIDDDGRFADTCSEFSATTKKKMHGVVSRAMYEIADLIRGEVLRDIQTEKFRKRLASWCLEEIPKPAPTYGDLEEKIRRLKAENKKLKNKLAKKK